jgi:hypothetical protein
MFPPMEGQAHESRKGLVVEQLGAETLVYDTDADEAHLLGPAAAAEFGTAADDVSRREVLRKLALAGAGAAAAAPLITSIVAPRAAHAQSCVPICKNRHNCCLDPKADCGFRADGCGTLYNCGGCGHGRVCVGNTCV